MNKIIIETEKGELPASKKVDLSSNEYLEKVLLALSSSARDAATNLHAKAIVVFTQGGQVARFISKLRPPCPIIGIAKTPVIGRKLGLLFGVIPFVLPYSKNLLGVIRQTDKLLLKNKLAKRHDPIIIVSGKQSLPGFRYINKIHRVGSY